MPLQAKLDEIKAGFKESADSESLALMDRAAKELAESGILEKVLQRGDRMPEFTLAAAQGGDVNARELLPRGPLVLTFYRGGW